MQNIWKPKLFIKVHSNVSHHFFYYISRQGRRTIHVSTADAILKVVSPLLMARRSTPLLSDMDNPISPQKFILDRLFMHRLMSLKRSMALCKNCLMAGFLKHFQGELSSRWFPFITEKGNCVQLWRIVKVYDKEGIGYDYESLTLIITSYKRCNHHDSVSHNWSS